MLTAPFHIEGVGHHIFFQDSEGTLCAAMQYERNDAMSVLTDTALQTRIDALHAQSVAQEAETNRYFGERAKKGDLSWDGLDADANRFMADKLVALEPIKAEFCCLLCRALQARRVVEVGTSYGVSTLYLADAVRANGGGTVIGTEYEPAKAAAARGPTSRRPASPTSSTCARATCARR